MYIEKLLSLPQGNSYHDLQKFPEELFGFHQVITNHH
jgi:hypothetical protein